MLSKNKIKFINSIKKKKYREIHQCFFVEGEKIAGELINSEIEVHSIYATTDWINKNDIPNLRSKITEVSDDELEKISSLTSPNKVFAIVKKPIYRYFLEEIESELSIFLDNINDPGNLGTIIRIADWFGINNIFCTKESVDAYNSKTVQASMGSIFRVKVHYVDVRNFFSEVESLTGFSIYGTLLEGKDIYTESLNQNGLIVMGSESHGISEIIKPFIHQKLFIPNYPFNNKSTESLNISVATAIVCSEFRRRAQ